MSLVTNAVAGWLVIHSAEEGIRESGILPLSKSFFLSGVACCLSWPALSLFQRNLFRRKHQWMRQEYITPLMGYGLCQLPVTQSALSQVLPLTNRREVSHPVLRWQVFPQGKQSPYSHKVGAAVLIWCCLKTWCSFDLRLLTHLQDLPGTRREVIPGAPGLWGLRGHSWEQHPGGSHCLAAGPGAVWPC